MNIREQLDKCWEFADKYKTCSIESANDSFEIIKSRSYYGRLNDFLVFAFPENWRQLDNYYNNRPFSFYVDNLFEAEAKPEIYSRLQVWGQLYLYSEGTEEFIRYLPFWKKAWEDLPAGNPMVPKYVAILRPYKFELNIRPVSKGANYSRPLDGPASLFFSLGNKDFDVDDRYVEDSSGN